MRAEAFDYRKMTEELDKEIEALGKRLREVRGEQKYLWITTSARVKLLMEELLELYEKRNIFIKRAEEREKSKREEPDPGGSSKDKPGEGGRWKKGI